MQYLLRFYLSIIVVLSHLWTDLFASGEGSYAVMGFYVISGYVITLAITNHYASLDNGFKRFWANRFLRLYPTYTICALIGLFAIIYFPETAKSVNFRMILPNSLEGITALEKKGISEKFWSLFYVQQITLVGTVSPFIYRSPISFAPTAWSVNMEIYYYLLLSFGITVTLAKSQKFLYISIALISIYFVLLTLQEANFLRINWGSPLLATNFYTLFYRSFLGITIFFAVGGHIFHLKKLKVGKPTRLAITVLVLMLPFLNFDNRFALTISFVFFGLAIAVVIRMWPDDRPNGAMRFFGDLSYPLFLIHWPIAVLTTAITGLEKNSGSFFVLATSASLITAGLIVIFLERPLERLRSKVRQKAID